MHINYCLDIVFGIFQFSFNSKIIIRLLRIAFFTLSSMLLGKTLSRQEPELKNTHGDEAPECLFLMFALIVA